MIRVWLKYQVGMALFVAAAAASSGARAQAGKPAQPASSAAAPTALAPAPDVVRLKNGGMLRGTIAESVPGDSVTLVLITGETRKIPFADVTYAGSASSEPSAAPAPAPAPTPAPAPAAPPAPVATKPPADAQAQPFAVVHAAEARVNFASEPAGNTLFRRSSTASFVYGGRDIPVTSGYTEVCTAPCNASMPAGTHTFGLAKAGGAPLQADPVTLPAGESTLTGKYKDRTAVRIGVGVAGGVAAVVGYVIAFSAIDGTNTDDGQLYGGIALGTVGLFTLFSARWISDGVEFSVAPGAPAPAVAGRPDADQRGASSAGLGSPFDTRAARGAVSGLTLTARF